MLLVWFCYGIGVVLARDWYGIGMATQQLHVMVLASHCYGIGVVLVWYWYGVGMLLVWFSGEGTNRRGEEDAAS